MCLIFLRLVSKLSLVAYIVDTCCRCLGVVVAGVEIELYFILIAYIRSFILVSSFLDRGGVVGAYGLYSPYSVACLWFSPFLVVCWHIVTWPLICHVP